MFKYETNKPITEEDFINNIAEDIVDNLCDEDKQNWIDNIEYDRFGRDMWVKNKYLWGQNLPFIVNLDDLSLDIFNKAIELLRG